MDVRVKEVESFFSSKKGSTIVFFLEVRFGHWRWSVTRSLEEIKLLHTQIDKTLKKEKSKETPSFPSGGEDDLDALKANIVNYFGELVAIPQAESALIVFIGRTTLTGECKTMNNKSTVEGMIRAKSNNTDAIASSKVPLYFYAIQDTVYYFSKRVVDSKPCDLPLGSISLRDASIKKVKNEVTITSPIGEYNLLCSSKEEAKKWYKNLKKGTSYDEEENESELTPVEKEKVEELKNFFPTSEQEELIHFLQAYSGDIEKTKIMYKSHLQWQSDVRLKEVKISSVYAQLSSGRLFYTNTKDKLGRPILIFRAARHDPSIDYLDTMILGMYLIDRAVSDAEGGKIVVINDLTGFEKKHNDFRMNKLILEMVLAHFPNRVGAVWCVAAPWTFRIFFRVIKPWLGDDMISRVHLFGGFTEIQEFIAPDQLLTDFGGEAKENIEGWAKERALIEGVSLDKAEHHQFANEEIVAAFSDAPVHQTADACILEGWLKKQGGFVKKFNKRYCILKGTILYYYQSQTDAKADGVVFLRGATLATDGSSTFHIITSGNKDCVFQLVDKKDLNWLKQLEIVIVNHGGSIGTSHGDNSASDPYDDYCRSWNVPGKLKKDSVSSSSLFLDELFIMYNDKSLNRFPNGHIPGNEVVEALLTNGAASDRPTALTIASAWFEHQILMPLSSKCTCFKDQEDTTFIFGFLSSSTVRNVLRICKTPSSMKPDVIIKSLFDQLVTLLQKHSTLSREDILCSREYFDFLLAVVDLQLVSLDSLKQSKEFFFNVRSLLLLHSQIQFGLSSGCQSRFHLFNTAQYIIGTNHYSIADLTHGILRGNAPAPESLLAKHWEKKDIRLSYSLKDIDERISFALPGITLEKFHFCEQYEETLKIAMDAFVEKEMNVLAEKVVQISVMLTWVKEADKLGFLALHAPQHTDLLKPPVEIVLTNMNWSQLGLGDHLKEKS